MYSFIYNMFPWLAHWGRVTHICVGKLIIIGSDNDLSPDRRQAIIWINAGLLSIGPLRTHFQWNFNQNTLIFINKNAHENGVCEMASILNRPQCVSWTHRSLVYLEAVLVGWCLTCTIVLTWIPLAAVDNNPKPKIYALIDTDNTLVTYTQRCTAFTETQYWTKSLESYAESLCILFYSVIVFLCIFIQYSCQNIINEIVDDKVVHILSARETVSNSMALVINTGFRYAPLIFCINV